MRLIDADRTLSDTIYRKQATDAIMELIEARHEWKSDASREINALDAAYCAIEDLPSVDAVPVIRCKDCKHYKKVKWDHYDEDRQPKRKYCHFLKGEPIVVDTEPNDFCSYAEEKKRKKK